MRTLDKIRAEMDRELRRLAQAYLYGTPGECERHRLAVERLVAEEHAAKQQCAVMPVVDDVLMAH